MPYTLSDFDYDHPPGLIAQRPLPERDASRLLCLDRASGDIHHESFRDLPRHAAPGDVLVLNTSRVITARLIGTRENGRPAEVLLVHPESDGDWLAMVHPGGKLKAGRTVSFDDEARLEITGVVGGGLRRVRLTGNLGWTELMDRYGAVPLPPYVHRPADAEDRDRYQTIFARLDGSVAAPTAGLHFTEASLDRLRAAGMTIAEVVLHVGPGTFKPVQVDDPTEHQMHAEWYSIPTETAETVNGALDAGRRIWAVGTTVTRVLETAARDGRIAATQGWTDLFIFPPYEFRIVGALLTNFHLPQSTLLMLVCAFGGHGRVMTAYHAAVDSGYRLFSYGDAMLIT